MTVHAPSDHARKSSAALLISLALHAALLLALSFFGVIGAVEEPAAPFPIYLGPIGAAGGVGASSGVGAPAPAAGGEAVARVEAHVAPEPKPVATPKEHEAAVPKPRRTVANESRPTETASRSAEPSSSEGASSAGAGRVGAAGGVPGSVGAGGGGVGGTASYEQALAAWLDGHKYYPSSLRRRGIEGDGKLRIRISRSGKLLGVEVTRAFSHPSLESIAEDWVKRSEPFPPMPASILGESYTFVVPVVFRLE